MEVTPETKEVCIAGAAPAGLCPRAEAPPSPPTISLEETQRRFERESVRGICDTGGYHCHYYVWGTGPPLILVPGLADDALSFLLLSSHLVSHFRCIAYDLPGGRGDGARLGRYTHFDLVADLIALLDHLNIRQSYAFGSSFGSTIVLAALHAHPERLPRAVLQGGFAYRRLAPAEILLARVARYWPGPMRLLPFRKALLRRCHYRPFVSRSPQLWEYFLLRTNAPPIAAVAHRAVMLHELDLRPILREIRQPVLLICGEGDPLVGPECEETLLHGLPSAWQVKIEGCGHNPLFSHPEVLADLVGRFFTPPE
jgi:pimeloyl-ACP methyl ester carboxylesterase